MTDADIEGCIPTVRAAVMTAVKQRAVPMQDADDVIQSAMERIVRYHSWSMSKGALSTWAARVAWGCVAEYRRRRGMDADMKAELAGKPIDPMTIRPCAAIRDCPDALYEWEEQIGRWMVDNVPIWPAMLAKLRNHLVKHYELKSR